MGRTLFAEVEVLTEAAQINGMVVAFIKVRAHGFWRFEEDGSRRRWWSTVSSVTKSESLAEIYFRLIVRKSFLSLVDYNVDCAVYVQTKVVVLLEKNII